MPVPGIVHSEMRRPRPPALIRTWLVRDSAWLKTRSAPPDACRCRQPGRRGRRAFSIGLMPRVTATPGPPAQPGCLSRRFAKRKAAPRLLLRLPASQSLSISITMSIGRDQPSESLFECASALLSPYDLSSRCNGGPPCWAGEGRMWTEEHRARHEARLKEHRMRVCHHRPLLMQVRHSRANRRDQGMAKSDRHGGSLTGDVNGPGYTFIHSRNFVVPTLTASFGRRAAQ